MKKRILSWLLAIALICTLLPLASTKADADNVAMGECGENLSWVYDYDTGELTIEGTGDMYDWETGWDVPWSDMKWEIRTVFLPDGLTGIGSNAFGDCAELSVVNIPASVAKIGSRAFSCCASLERVTVPEGVSILGEGMFYGCEKLTELLLPDSLTEIGDEVFENCASLASVTIPRGVADIGKNVFLYCSSLTQIVVSEENQHFSCDSFGALFDKEKTRLICVPLGFAGEYTVPAGVVSIEGSAFCGCSGLTKVIFPEGLTTIGENAFGDCVSLTEATIPQGVVTIGDYAFSGCASLETAAIPDSVTGIGYGAFERTAISSVNIPEGVTGILGGCFRGCESLKSVVLPNSVTEIGDEAFYGCTALKEINLPENLADIGERAFAECSSLTEISLPAGLTGLRNYSFSGCSGLRRITIPGSVGTVWEGAFSGCSGLTSVTIQEGVTMIEPFAFGGCSKLAWAYIPASVESLIWRPIGFVYDEETYEQIVLPGFKIYGFAGTSAESYANNNGIPFCPIDPASGFSDVSTGAFYYKPMLWALENGITTGTSEFTFGPKADCTRAQVVTFLWRAKGCPEPTQTENPFVDVKPSAFYYDAVLWAVENGITSGMDATHFKPKNNCTRGQVVTFLWRAAGEPEPETTENVFTDVSAKASYYKAVLWAVEKGITKGSSATTFGPKAACTRAHVVTFLYRNLGN